MHSYWSVNWHNRFTRSFPITHTDRKQINTHHKTNAEESSTATASWVTKFTKTLSNNSTLGCNAFTHN
jgi:hypothetical protein